MPRRTIRLGLQPSTFSFQDDHGPLVNGLASAAQSFMEGGQRRAELDMAREQQANEAAAGEAELQRQIDRDLSVDQSRTRELDLREREITDRRASSLRDDMGGLLKGVAGFFKPDVAAQRLAFDREQANIKNAQVPPSKTGSDAFTPDELAHRQMLADREADAAGVTIYEDQLDELGQPTGKPVRKLGAGKTWDDVLRIYKKWDILPAGIEPQEAAPAAPPSPVAPGLQDSVGSDLAPAPESMAGRGTMETLLTDTLGLGTGTEAAYAKAGVTKSGFAAVQAMRDGGVIQVDIGGPNYKIGVQALAQLDAATREAEIRAIIARDPAYAQRVISDLLAAGVE